MERIFDIDRPSTFTLDRAGLEPRRGFFYPFESLSPIFQSCAQAVGRFDNCCSAFVLEESGSQFVVSAAHSFPETEEGFPVRLQLAITGESTVIESGDMVPLPESIKGLDIAVARISPLKSTIPLRLPIFESDHSVLEDDMVAVLGYPYNYCVTRQEQNPLCSIGKIVSVEFDGTHLKTDARTEPGNSGSPLLNSKGEVIGVHSSAWTDQRNYPKLEDRELDMLNEIEQTAERRTLRTSYEVRVYPLWRAGVFTQ